MPTEEEVQYYVDSDVPPFSMLLAAATQMIDDYIGGATVPPAVYDFCVADLTQTLVQRSKSPGGVMQFGDIDVVRSTPNDPMNSIYPLLRQYAGGFC